MEAPGGYSSFPWYALRENYCTAITAAGGVPLPLPHGSIDEYIGLIDGLVVTGGGFDIDPNLYGDTTSHPTVTTKPGRTAFEWDILNRAHQHNKAILGICGGMQLLNVVLGGSLIQHIPGEVSDCLQHEQTNPASEASHTITITDGSFLHKIVGQKMIAVNSSHHQAVKVAAPALVINAIATDGVIEGIEDPKRRFCLGVQWHPEFHISQADRQIFQAFISQAQR
jgi:putative glutamine amidotransferase